MSMLATDPVLDNMMRRFGTLFGDTPRLLNEAEPGSSAMPLDVVRHDDHVVLFFDIPGVESDDIELTVDGRELVVHAERNNSIPEGATLVRSERRHGVLERRVQLGESLDLDRLSAHHAHGLLEIVVPFAASAKPRKVTIGTTASSGGEIES